MFRRTFLAGLMLCPGLLGTMAAVAAGPFFAPEPLTTPGAPFSGVAQTQSTTVFADGNRIVRNNTVHYYRDGQGRIRTESNPGAMGETGSSSASPRIGVLTMAVIQIEDPLTNERISLMPQAKLATVFKMPEGTKVGLVGPAGPASKNRRSELFAPVSRRGAHCPG